MTKFIIITTEVGKGRFVASAISVNENGIPTSSYLNTGFEVSRAVAKDRLLAKITAGDERIPVGKTWRLE
jgi:hypothetical protein